MNLDDLLLNIKNIRFDSVVKQTSIQTEEERQQYNEKGYRIPLILQDFIKAVPEVNPEYICYSPSISLDCFYYNPDSLAVCPLHLEMLLSGMMESFGGLDGFYKAVKSREKEVANGKYMGSILVLADAMRVEYFNILVEKKGAFSNLYSLFLSIYTSSDYGFNAVQPEIFDKIVATKTEEEKQKTLEELQTLPEVFTVYRGIGSKGTPASQAYSWTMDIGVANFFATRHGTEDAQIIKGEVCKADVVESLINYNGEAEILVRPSNVKVVDTINLLGYSDYATLVTPILPLYQKYRNMLHTLTFTLESDIHTEIHALRVLLMTLTLGAMKNLPNSDLTKLATAAIYHDTRRVNDSCDFVHGADSKNYYIENVVKVDPVVAFLIEYHSRPDEDGYSEIESNRVLSKHRSKNTLLFNIFKDADALDRVRLGLKDLDLNQLRLEESKTLSLIAKLNLEMLKL